ncbi:hypothetical protein ACFLZZ_04090 [Nanoarchaeota archaeon]
MRCSPLFIAIIILVVLILCCLLNFTGSITGRAITSINTCTDTDFGKDLYIKGEVSGREYTLSPLNPDFFYYADKCVGSDILEEYFCLESGGVNSFKASKKYLCKDGCLDGQCIGVERAIEQPAPTNRFWINLRELLLKLDNLS